MDDQQRLGRPPTEVLHLTVWRDKGGRLSLNCNSRPIGVDLWDRTVLSELDYHDLLEAAIVELERRLI